MVLQAIIADWNGTLIVERNELPILRQMAIDIARWNFPLHPSRIAGIIMAGRELNRIYARRKEQKDLDYVERMYDVFNRRILEGTPIATVRDSVRRYAADKAVQERLDRNILSAVRKYHDMGKTCGILSAGYAHGIDRILAAAGFRDLFDFLVADDLVEINGAAQKLMLKIYRTKGVYLKRLLEQESIDPRRSVYIGDTQDDEDCFELVAYPVVSFFAPAHFKEYCASKYHAFVPKDKQDLLDFLEKIDK